MKIPGGDAPLGPRPRPLVLPACSSTLRYVKIEITKQLEVMNDVVMILQINVRAIRKERKEEERKEDLI